MTKGIRILRNLSAKLQFFLKFAPLHCPHHHRSAEAEVKLAKRLILHSIGTQILTFIKMQTKVCKAEAIFNLPPLGKDNSSFSINAHKIAKHQSWYIENLLGISKKNSLRISESMKLGVSPLLDLQTKMAKHYCIF
jgi:hypothetical protein